MKKWLLPPFMVFFALGTLPAATVSLLVVETGLSGESGRPQSSLLWENGLFDVFFDAGHIVSNAPIMRLPEKTTEKLPGEVRTELDQAKNGGADYFIVILLEYPGAPAIEETPVPAGTPALTGELSVFGGKPEKVYMRIFSVADETLVYEASCAGNTRLDVNEELLEVKKNAAKLIPQLRRRG
ncbi:MAG: hypothetical protein LBH35_05535 [Treponema sp.]|nr:hypothetical protein [Treponema sp.]